MQQEGSAITYAKRYNIGCLLNIQTDSDDDGNNVSNKQSPVAQVSAKSVIKTKIPSSDMFSMNNAEHKRELTEVFKQKLGLAGVPTGAFLEQLKQIATKANGTVDLGNLNHFVDSFLEGNS